MTLPEIVDLMSPEEAKAWYASNSKHLDLETKKLASGLPGKSGRYKVNVFGQKLWVFYSLLYTPSRSYTGTTEGQILARREYLEDQGVMFVASEVEPHYIKDVVLVLPSGYRQKVRLSYCVYKDLNIMRLKGREELD